MSLHIAIASAYEEKLCDRVKVRMLNHPLRIRCWWVDSSLSRLEWGCGLHSPYPEGMLRWVVRQDRVKESGLSSLISDRVVTKNVGMKVWCNYGLIIARSLKGYVFIVFEEETSVQRLVRRCHKDGDDYYLLLSSPTMKNKPVGGVYLVFRQFLREISPSLCG